MCFQLQMFLHCLTTNGFRELKRRLFEYHCDRSREARIKQHVTCTKHLPIVSFLILPCLGTRLSFARLPVKKTQASVSPCLRWVRMPNVLECLWTNHTAESDSPLQLGNVVCRKNRGVRTPRPGPTWQPWAMGIASHTTEAGTAISLSSLRVQDWPMIFCRFSGTRLVEVPCFQLTRRNH